MLNNWENKNGGFIQIILFIIIALWLMNYFGLSITGLINWVKALFYGAL